MTYTCLQAMLLRLFFLPAKIWYTKIHLVWVKMAQLGNQQPHWHSSLSPYMFNDHFRHVTECLIATLPKLSYISFVCKYNTSFCGFFSNGPPTMVTSVFGGILQNEVNCLICDTESKKFDPFLGKLFFF